MPYNNCRMTPLMGIKAVIYDLDDTLVMTEEASWQLENKILRHMNRPEMTREQHRTNWGMPLEEAIFERSPGVSVDEFMRLYAQLLQEEITSGRLDNFTSNVTDTLKTLNDRGYQQFIVTSRNLLELQHLLNAKHHLQTVMRAIYHRDNTTGSKPDPSVFSWLYDYGFQPSACVYVGDSFHDAAAANAAGIHFIASLESGLRQRENFGLYQVDAFIIQFQDLLQLLPGD